jgi:hypothetical protein
MEECDYGSLPSSDWLRYGCDSNTCKISWVVTIPEDGKLVFNPTWSYVIWDAMDLFKVYNLDKPSVYNQSNYDFKFRELCVVNKSGNSLAWSTYCEPMNQVLGAGEKFTMRNIPSFTWDIRYLWNNTFGDNTLVITVSNESWVRYDDAWFASKIAVRVAKPSVWTTWGWTSYISNPKDISDVSKVAIENEDENKNFAWVWVSTWNLSSYTSEVKDSESVKEVWKEWEKINQTDIWTDNTSAQTTWTNANSSQNINDFTSYNWLANAFIIKNTKFTISEYTLYNLSWARTYIIEDADLVIDSNISYADNIAFVVKGWNILIDKWVTSIKGTFIAIPKWEVWWNIIWTNGKTTEALTIYGSLYWNVEDLVSNRTYIKQNSSWLLDVWTIVSFGSSVFRDPAPLTTTFINEYLEATKVAQ